MNKDATIEGTKVVLKRKKDQIETDSQLWMIDPKTMDAEGWFKLKNPASGKFLTATSLKTLSISGKFMPFITPFDLNFLYF